MKKRGIFDETDEELDPEAWWAENPEPPEPGPEPDKKIYDKAWHGIGGEWKNNPKWPSWQARQNTYDAWMARWGEAGRPLSPLPR